MRQKKVLYIAETTSGGSAYSLFNLVREIRKKKYNSLILFIKIDNPDVLNRVRKEGIDVISFDKKQLGGSQVNRKRAFDGNRTRMTVGSGIQRILGQKAAAIYYSIRSFYYFLRYQAALILPIMRIVRRHKIDLIHLNSGLQNGLAAILSAKILGVPIVCHTRMFSKWSGFEKLFIRLVDRFIYISEAVSNHFVKHGIPPRQGIVIYNALDLNDFSYPYDNDDVRREFGWNNGEQIIGIVGRVAEWKGQAFFLEALSECSKKYPGLRGMIVGEHYQNTAGKEYFDNLNSLVETLGLREKVVFTGFRSDIPRLVSALDVIVHSSIKPEPFGRVLIEGMACAKPVIGTSAGGVPEIIQNNVTGLLVPCGDSSAMAIAIDKVLADKKLAIALGRSARRKVEKMFTIQQHVSEILRLYNAVLKN